MWYIVRNRGLLSAISCQPTIDTYVAGPFADRADALSEIQRRESDMEWKRKAVRSVISAAFWASYMLGLLAALDYVASRSVGG